MTVYSFFALVLTAGQRIVVTKYSLGNQYYFLSLPPSLPSARTFSFYLDSIGCSARTREKYMSLRKKQRPNSEHSYPHKVLLL